MQISALKYNSFLYINKKYIGQKPQISNGNSESFSFPSYKAYASFRPLSFKAIGDYDGLTKEEIAEIRKKRKEQKKADKQRRYEQRQLKKVLDTPISTVNEDEKTIDIIAKAAYPANVISNFNREENVFYVDGVPCHSIEGFLQSLKTPDEELQRELCLKSGSSARYMGRKLTGRDNWKERQILYWKGVSYPRESDEYKNLVKKAFFARFNASNEYRDALNSTKGYSLTHKCGAKEPKDTVLTEQEFISILDELRQYL